MPQIETRLVSNHAPEQSTFWNEGDLLIREIFTYTCPPHFYAEQISSVCKSIKAVRLPILAADTLIGMIFPKPYSQTTDSVQFRPPNVVAFCQKMEIVKPVSDILLTHLVAIDAAIDPNRSNELERIMYPDGYHPTIGLTSILDSHLRPIVLQQALAPYDIVFSESMKLPINITNIWERVGNFDIVSKTVRFDKSVSI